MSERITTAAEVREATLTVYTKNGVVESAPVMVRSGQVAEGRVATDSVTGELKVRVDVFDAHQ